MRFLSLEDCVKEKPKCSFLEEMDRVSTRDCRPEGAKVSDFYEKKSKLLPHERTALEHLEDALDILLEDGDDSAWNTVLDAFKHVRKVRKSALILRILNGDATTDEVCNQVDEWG